MNSGRLSALSRLAGSRVRAWAVCAIALASFAAGSLVAARPAQPAGGDRVFELLIYHAVSGKVPKLEARFGRAASLFTQHGLDVLGYWVPEDPAWADTFVYLVAHSSREEAKQRWHEFHADPTFQQYVSEEKQEQLIEKVDKTFMQPTDFSKTR